MQIHPNKKGRICAAATPHKQSLTHMLTGTFHTTTPSEQEEGRKQDLEFCLQFPSTKRIINSAWGSAVKCICKSMLNMILLILQLPCALWSRTILLDSLTVTRGFCIISWNELSLRILQEIIWQHHCGKCWHMYFVYKIAIKLLHTRIVVQWQGSI